MSWMHRLVRETGGAIEQERFVTRPGCMLIARTAATPAGRALMQGLNIGESADYADLAELGSRLTYLSFADAPDAERSRAYLTKVAVEAQHLSIFGASHATFLVAGIAVETSLELVAHREARVARLTTSNTKAMDAPLFRLQGSAEAQARQRRDILAALAAFGPRADGERELANMQHPGSKATALTFTMCLKDFHTLFIGRLPARGNELEVREICARMCEILHTEYPLVIREPASYAGLDNGAKYGP